MHRNVAQTFVVCDPKSHRKNMPLTPPPLPPRRFTSYHDVDNQSRGSFDGGPVPGRDPEGLHFMVPFQRPAQLVGRDAYIAKLDRLLTRGVGHKRVALYGLGGIG